jgi:hypothetical protein
VADLQPIGAPQEVSLGCILKYGEDWKRGFNADIGRKDIFEIASIEKITTDV